jgi:hypothetical protein
VGAVAEVALPEVPRPAKLRGVVIKRHEVAGEALLSVTMWQGNGRRAKRRWFTSRGVALSYAADRADDLGLLVIDLSDPADEGQ